MAAAPAVTGLNASISTLDERVTTLEGEVSTINSTLLTKADLVAGEVPVSQLPDFQVPLEAYDEGVLISSNFTGIRFLDGSVSAAMNGSILEVAFSGGSGGGSVWGGITGTLSTQTDLQSALDAKVSTSRQLTINGVTYDLTADRSWGVGDVLTSGSYANPTWITSLDWAKITGKPTTLSGYGITDAWSLASGGALTGDNTISGAFDVSFTNNNVYFNNQRLKIYNAARTFSTSFSKGDIS